MQRWLSEAYVKANDETHRCGGQREKGQRLQRQVEGQARELCETLLWVALGAALGSARRSARQQEGYIFIFSKGDMSQPSSVLLCQTAPRPPKAAAKLGDLSILLGRKNTKSTLCEVDAGCP